VIWRQKSTLFVARISSAWSEWYSSLRVGICRKKIWSVRFQLLLVWLWWCHLRRPNHSVIWGEYWSRRVDILASLPFRKLWGRIVIDLLMRFCKRRRRRSWSVRIRYLVYSSDVNLQTTSHWSFSERRNQFWSVEVCGLDLYPFWWTISNRTDLRPVLSSLENKKGRRKNTNWFALPLGIKLSRFFLYFWWW
jgi:hypothetical protein